MTKWYALRALVAAGCSTAFKALQVLYWTRGLIYFSATLLPLLASLVVDFVLRKSQPFAWQVYVDPVRLYTGVVGN